MAFRATRTSPERTSPWHSPAGNGLIAALFLLPGVLSGCHATLPSCDTVPPAASGDYALVEYRLREETGREPKVEVSDTDTYRTGQSYPTAALRLPDACLGDGSGAAARKCATWAKEIESALAGEGVRVIGSDPVVKLEREKALSTFGAAKELGADIVFVFNALEAREITVSASGIASSKTYASDAQAKRGAPLTLDQETSASFLAYTSQQARKGLDLTTAIALSSMLDATAIVTKTGESIWFYRRSVTVPTSASQGMRFLFGRAPGGKWAPALPEGVKEEAAPPNATPASAPTPGEPAGETSGAAAPIPAPETPTDTAASETHAEAQRELMAASAKDFVSAFRSSKVEAGREEGLSK